MIKDTSTVIHGNQYALLRGRAKVSLTFSVITILLLSSSLLDLPRNIYISGMTLSSLLSALSVGIMWISLTINPRFPKSTKVVIGLLILLSWGLLSFLWNHPQKQGIQNISVLFVFVGLILISARESSNNVITAKKINTIFIWCSIFAMLIYVSLTLLLGQDSRNIMFPRAFSIFALLIISVALADYRYSQNKKMLFFSIIALIIICFTLSRTAMVIGFILFPLSQIKLNTKGITRFITLTVAALGVIYVIINRVGVIRERFFSGDMSMSIGGISINAMGRTELWDFTLNSFYKNPIFGSGVGSIQVELGSYFYSIDQPHNDYLRVLHDYGIVGFAFFVLGFLCISISSIKKWARSDKNNSIDAKYHLACVLSMISILTLMMTDNPIVYMFVMIPFGILIGLSIGKKV
ncbi:O-antigen ligase family protein [Paenibacillus sp. ATY16]|uniref:O-antigen ligase family protein n=1 Tax=Paenibacillus sp. ATY16 TaxID=1759312 RepID=UPI00200D1BB9|nr:O-antigen ligase family protein [Paenibacillus sp. ATY16]MCK9861966.1 O-antigen ligase family protein [Paenibacillus sp. ATY16]